MRTPFRDPLRLALDQILSDRAVALRDRDRAVAEVHAVALARVPAQSEEACSCLLARVICPSSYAMHGPKQTRPTRRRPLRRVQACLRSRRRDS